MARIYAPRPAEVFVLSEANGFKSRDEGLFKQDAVVYGVGQIVTKDVNGKFVRLTSEILDDADTIAFVLRAVEAFEADTIGAILDGSAEIKAREIDLPAGVTLAELEPLLRAQGIKVR